MNTEQKTPEQWFQQLKEPYRSEAIANIGEKAHFYEKYPESLVNAIVFSFHWNSTSQGFEYWEKIYDSIQAGETTYLETELKPQDEKKEVSPNIYKPLFDLMHSMFGEDLLHSEMEEIINVCEKILEARKDEKKEVESELKEGEVYFYNDELGWYSGTDLQQCTELANSGTIIYRATPIGTKQTKSILEPIKK